MKRRAAPRQPADRRRRNAEVLFKASFAHHAKGLAERAELGYRQVLRLVPDHVSSLVNLGNLLQARGERDEAIACYEKAIASDRALPEAHHNLGNVYRDAGRFEAAIENYRRALALRPGYVGAQYNLALALRSAGRDREALEALQRTLEIDPSHLGACHLLFKVAIGSCDFAMIEAITERIANAIPNYVPRARGYRILGNIAYDHMFYPLPAPLYRMLTDRIAELLSGEFQPLPPRTRSEERTRLRVGYISPNFGDHPVGHVTRSLFRSHERDAFEVFGYATRDRSREPTDFHRAIRAGFEHYVDLSPMAPQQAAQRIAADDIDILVDLDGYMDLTSPPIMAQRPARIQAYWLGHAGGLRLPFIDYLIADPIVVRNGEEKDYREAIVRLPEVYHPTDRAPIAPRAPTRAQEGLPEDGVVFCAFNNPEKIDRKVFDAWMRILRAVPNGVLWLSDRRKYADPRPVLCAAAQKRGVKPQRIVFARHAPDKAVHLARHCLADLFLDTITLNAATTALDALWAGVPVLTMEGDTFASRMAASFVRAIGIPDLICSSLEEYESRAVALARDPSARSALRTRLLHNRDTEPLFQVERLARHLEGAYHEMWRRYRAGKPAKGFDVRAREREVIPAEMHPEIADAAPEMDEKAAIGGDATGMTDVTVVETGDDW